MSSSITFSERELQVLTAVLKGRFAVPSLTTEEWKEVAAEANITNGDVARNARYAFRAVLDKLGCKRSGAAGQKRKANGTRTVKEKGTKGEEDKDDYGADNDSEDHEPALKKAKMGRGKVSSDWELKD